MTHRNHPRTAAARLAWLGLSLSLSMATSLAAAAPIAGQGSWETTLQARDLDQNGSTDAFYDTVLNLTWLRNADAAGQMTWGEARLWAANLAFGGRDDWRLPSMQDAGADGCNFAFTGTDCGYNVNTAANGGTPDSELAHLYYVSLGNQAYYDQAGLYQPAYGLINTGDFQNMQPYSYWTGRQDSPDLAWNFSTDDGLQDISGQGFRFHAMAVASGDFTSPVPEPATFWLTAAGGLMLLAARKRLRRSGVVA